VPDSLSIAVLGPLGRLGSAITLEIAASRETRLTGAVVRSESSEVQRDIGTLLSGRAVGIRTCVSLEEGVAGAEVVIDASTPEMTISAAQRLAERGGPALVTGVTGFDRMQEEALEEAAKTLPILKAGNFSLGVALAEELVAQAAAGLEAAKWDIEIEETHHRAKQDAPSGTALMLGRAAAKGRKEHLDEVAVHGRTGRTGPREPGTIGFAVTRGGGVLGEHAARFLSEMEELAISHRAFDRRVFARGALAAAQWLCDKPAGLYSMRDVVSGDS
jgi:4-hydroxy-tetrahydrodipicolinate reductase